METTKSRTSGTSAPRQLGSAFGDLLLEISGNSANPETVRVRAAKCTI